MSSKYLPEARLEYDVLSHDHFRLASQHTNPSEVLEYAVSKVDDYGRPATVDDCYQEFMIEEIPFTESDGLDVKVVVDKRVDVVRSSIVSLTKLYDELEEEDPDMSARIARITGDLFVVMHDLLEPKK